MKIGIRAHDLGMKSNAAELAAAAREAGFDAVQLVLHKGLKNARHEAGELDAAYASAIADAFRGEGIAITMLGAYFDWFHYEDNKGFDKFCEHLKYAADFGTSLVGTEVQGHACRRWEPNPENETKEAFERVVQMTGELTDCAKRCGAMVCLEGAAAHVLSTPEKVHQLCRRIDSDRIALTFDLYNFLTLDNYRDQQGIIERVIELYGERLKVVHCKDFLPGETQLKQVAPGKGAMDYRYLISRLKAAGLNDVTLVFEEVTGPDIAESMKHIRRILAAVL